MELSKEISTLEEYDHVKKVIEQAGGVEKWAKLAKDVVMLEKAIRYKRLGERRVGQYLISLAEQGLRYTGPAPKGVKIGSSLDGRFITLDKLGVTHKESREWQQTAKKPETEFKRDLNLEVKLQRAMVQRDRPTVKEVRQILKERNLKARNVREKKKAAEIKSLDGLPRYGVIVANPHWRRSGFDSKDKAGEKATVEELDQKIIDTGVDRIAADDCVLGLWCTEPWRGERVLRAWGFEPRAWFVWIKDVVQDKPREMMKKGNTLTVTGEAGLGHWNRDRAEIMLIGGRGRPVAPGKGVQGERVWFAERPSGTRGEKPDVALEWFEKHYPNMPKIELWARRYRKNEFNWASWGPDLPDGPWRIDDAANVALRLPREEVMSPDEKTPWDDAVVE